MVAPKAKPGRERHQKRRKNTGGKGDQLQLPIGHIAEETPVAWVAPARVRPVSTVCHHTARQAGKKSEKWIALRFSALPFIACKAPLPLACVVLDVSGCKPVIEYASGKAGEQGVRVGMALEMAYALCSELQVFRRDLAAEQGLLSRYAARAMVFSPRVAVSGEDVVLLEVAGSESVFGGFAALKKRIQAAFLENPLLACSPIPAASELLVRNALAIEVEDVSALRTVLGGLPLSAAPLSAALHSQLEDCGLETLQDVWRLPEGGVLRRFGAEFGEFSARLLGHRADPRRTFSVPAPFFRRVSLEYESDSQQILLQAAQRLLTAVQQFLIQRQAATESLIFSFEYVRYQGAAPAPLRLQVRVQRASAQTGIFLRQLEEKLAGCEFARAVAAVCVQMRGWQPLQPECMDVLAMASRKKAAKAMDDEVLIALLVARLGEKNMYRLEAVADHRPERAFVKRAWGMPYPALSPGAGNHARQPPRPLFLLPRPEPIQALGAAGMLGDVERIEAGWWQGVDIRRDYRQMQKPAGQRYWLFRERQPLSRMQAQEQASPPDGDINAAPRWFVHGVFA